MSARMQNIDFLPLVCRDIILRRLATSDFAAFQAYRHDPLVGLYQGWSPMLDEEAISYLADVSAAEPFCPGVWFQLGIAKSSDDTLIGDIGLRIDDDGEYAEIGFTLARESQRRGIATLAVREIINLVFRHTLVKKIIAITDARNQSSIRLLERLGMGRTSSANAIFRGESCLEHTYSLLRQDGD
jgi:RimJ/RimL family protein N-acetyltransferase